MEKGNLIIFSRVFTTKFVSSAHQRTNARNLDVLQATIPVYPYLQRSGDCFFFSKKTRKATKRRIHTHTHTHTNTRARARARTRTHTALGVLYGTNPNQSQPTATNPNQPTKIRNTRISSCDMDLTNCHWYVIKSTVPLAIAQWLLRKSHLLNQSLLFRFLFTYNICWSKGTSNKTSFLKDDGLRIVLKNGVFEF